MRRLHWLATISTVLALIALLAYSLERTTWLFALFEVDDTLPLFAAIVVEFAAVALLVGAGALDKDARAWANRALGAVLSVQALANLAAGYLRGDWEALGKFGEGWAAYAVTSTLWLVTNLAVPALVLFLSKLLERLIAALVERDGVVTVQSGVDETPVVQALTPAISVDSAVVEQEHTTSAPALSKTAQIKRLAMDLGVSETTVWRKVKAGEVKLDGNGVGH
jgi:hypothetical protein